MTDVTPTTRTKEEGRLSEFLNGRRGPEALAVAEAFIKELKSRKSDLYELAVADPASLHMMCEHLVGDDQIHATLELVDDKTARERFSFKHSESEDYPAYWK